jgi:hypothetical protein
VPYLTLGQPDNIINKVLGQKLKGVTISNFIMLSGNRQNDQKLK